MPESKIWKLIKNLKGEIDILTFPIIDIFKFWRLLNFFSHVRVQKKSLKKKFKRWSNFVLNAALRPTMRPIWIAT